MSKFPKSKRVPYLSDAELQEMPIAELRQHANDASHFARALESQAVRANRIYKRRRRSERATA